MRELMVASASRERLFSPATTWEMNSLTMSLPRSRELGSRPNLPSSTILSSKSLSAAFAPAAWAAACSGLFIGGSLVLFLAEFLLQPIQFLRTARGIHQQFIQLVVALQGAAQIAQLGPQIQKLL